MIYLSPENKLPPVCYEHTGGDADQPVLRSLTDMDNPTIEPAGFVYLISCAETNIVKIGYSLNPQRRLETLQSANPSKLTLQGAWPGTMQREQYIHRELRQFRISGEWFYLSAPTVLAKMTELLATELKDERFTKCFAPENPGRSAAL